MSGDQVICREFFETVIEEGEIVSRTITGGEVRTPYPMQSQRVWYRQAKLRCGNCAFRGWTSPWKISGPNDPRPTQEELRERIGDPPCPNCGTAKTKE